MFYYGQCPWIDEGGFDLSFFRIFVNMFCETMYIQLLFALPKKGVMKSIFCGTDINPVIWPMSFFFISIYEDLSFDMEAN